MAAKKMPRGLTGPPTETKTQRLPFHELHWDDFEELCRRLVQAEAAPGAPFEEVRLYGNRGQDQQGIDLVTKRRSENRDTVYQCKKVEKYTAADIREAVDKFLAGKFKDTSCRFVLCCTQPLTDTKQVEEIRAQRDRLHPIEFEVWDQVKLSEKLEHQHGLVEGFFSPHWVQAFCLSENRGLPDFATARTKLRAIFSTLDFAGVGVVQEGGPQSRVESVSLNDAYYELKFQRESREEEEPVFLLPEDLFRQAKSRHLVRGRGGSGKTTWLRRTFNRLVEDDRYFPLLIELRQLARTRESGKSSLESYLQQWLKEYAVDKPDEVLKSLLTHEDAPIPVLLVDGWDELGGLGTDVRARLMGLLNTCQRAQAIVTSRPYGEDRPTEGDGFTRWDLAPLTKEDMHAFSQHFYQACYPSDAPKARDYDTKFREALDRSPNAAQLGEVPLLLMMMLMISRTEVLPDKRHKLYERCIANLLEAIPKFQEDHGIRQHSQEWRPDDTEERMRVVAELAFRMKSEARATNDGAIRVDWQSALTYLPIEWKPTQREGFLYWLCSRAGLLVDFTDNSVQFAHLSFQEYLAAHHAEATIEGSARIEFALEKVADRTWWETLRLWASRVNGKNPRNWTPVLQSLIDTGSTASLDLAGAVIADGVARQLDESWAIHFVPLLAEHSEYLFAYCAGAIAHSSRRTELEGLLMPRFEMAVAESHITIPERFRLLGFATLAFQKTLKSRPSKPIVQIFCTALEQAHLKPESIDAIGRLWVDVLPTWGGTVATLHAWPSRRRLIGYCAQNWILHTHEPAFHIDWLKPIWHQLTRTPDPGRISNIAAWLAVVQSAWGVRETELVEAFFSTWSIDWHQHSPFRNALDHFGFWYPTWTVPAEEIKIRLLIIHGLNRSVEQRAALGLDTDPRCDDPRYRAFFHSEAANQGARAIMRAWITHAPLTEPDTPELVRLLQLSARGQDAWHTATTDIHPIWPAFGHHLARRSTPEEKALLESYAKDPDSANDPQLALGLRFIVRGDIMLPDGQFKTLDEIADEHGLPRLPFLEDVPEPFTIEEEK